MMKVNTIKKWHIKYNILTLALSKWYRYKKAKFRKLCIKAVMYLYAVHYLLSMLLQIFYIFPSPKSYIF